MHTILNEYAKLLCGLLMLSSQVRYDWNSTTIWGARTRPCRGV